MSSDLDKWIAKEAQHRFQKLRKELDGTKPYCATELMSQCFNQVRSEVENKIEAKALDHELKRYCQIALLERPKEGDARRKWQITLTKR